MQNDEEVRDRLDRIMTPKEILDPLIFDDKRQMLPEVREGLLRLVNENISKAFGAIKGLKVDGVYLNGSVAMYFYHDRSDIDLLVEIHNESCSYLSKDPEVFDRFLKAMTAQFLRKENYSFYQGRFVDITYSVKPKKILYQYSLLKDRWHVYRDRDIYKNFSKAKVLELYYEKKAKIEEDVKYLKKTLHGAELAARLSEYVKKQIEKNPLVISYPVYKLLSKTKIIYALETLFVKVVNRALSLYTDEEQAELDAWLKECENNPLEINYHR